MKKNISVNLQGMIFHVEEDGYEMLSQYLAAVKAYFSTYEGHEEIVADIESRIAEIFFSRLNPGKQVISRDDVQALIAQMGTVTDFEMVEEEADTSTGKAYGQQSAPYAPGEPVPREQKRLYRDVNRKLLAGVAAGIANYLQIDPLWIRLTFVLLVLGVPLTGGFTSFGVILYIICWIALPKSEALPEISARKLFRDPVDKKLGGVASGIAIYFGADVAIIRLVFLLLFILGGSGLLAYIILWIAVPEAKSITERVQMQGNPVTLSSIEASVKNSLNMQDADGQESTFAKILLFPVRLVAQVIQALSRLLQPFLAFLVTMVRVVAGLLIMLISGSIMMGLLIALLAGLGVLGQAEFVQMGDMPAALFFNSVPAWLVWAGFFAGMIPALLLFLLGVGLIARRFLLRPAVGWALLGVWLLSVAILISGIFFTARHFQESGEIVKEQTFPAAAYPTLLFNIRDTDHRYGHRLNMSVESHAGPDVKVIQTYTAKGLNEEEAIRNAQMISYKMLQQDSSIRFDDAFTFLPDAVFRDQDLDLKILIPEGKQLRFTNGFASHFARQITNDEYYSDDLASNTWQMKNNQLVCLTCSVVDTTARPSGRVAAGALDDDLALLSDDYQGVSKVYKVRDFSELEAGGAYHVRIRQSFRHHARATGSENELEKIKLRVQNGVLKISRDADMFNLWGSNKRPVLLEIETPDLKSVKLSGAAKVEIIGFAPDNFDLRQSGASEAAVSISTGRLEVDMSGASRAILKGHSDYLTIEGSGASRTDASRLRALQAEVDVSGASQTKVNAEQRLVIEASGASSVKYSGDVQDVRLNQSGGSRIARQK